MNDSFETEQRRMGGDDGTEGGDAYETLVRDDRDHVPPSRIVAGRVEALTEAMFPTLGRISWTGFVRKAGDAARSRPGAAVPARVHLRGILRGPTS